MTTSRVRSDYYTPDDFAYNNNTTRSLPHENYSYAVPNNSGVITNKTKNGSYNVVEKDFGDHKVIYHIPVEYGDNYDLSQLDETPIVEEQHRQHQQQQQDNSSRLVRRRIYQQYDTSNNDDEYEYVEEVPFVSPRRQVYVSPRRHNRETQVIKTIYEPQPPPRQTVEYIYEDDYSDVYDSRPENIEQVEYVVRERAPKQIYVEEPRHARRTVYVEDAPVPPPSPPPAPVSYSPRRSPRNTVVSHQPSPRPHVTHQPSPRPHVTHQPSPRTYVSQRLPSPAPVKPVHRNISSPQLSNRKQQTSRSPIYEPSNRSNVSNNNETPPLRLMDIIAQNRAKRGSRIPKPRREIDEEKVYDPPTYNRNIIKNGFIVHK